MSDAERIWSEKSDEDLLDAAADPSYGADLRARLAQWLGKAGGDACS